MINLPFTRCPNQAIDRCHSVFCLASTVFLETAKMLERSVTAHLLGTEDIAFRDCDTQYRCRLSPKIS